MSNKLRPNQRRQIETPRPRPQQPGGKGFGTNPAQSERHVHVAPEMIDPSGEKGYLDSFQETMYA